MQKSFAQNTGSQCFDLILYQARKKIKDFSCLFLSKPRRAEFSVELIKKQLHKTENSAFILTKYVKNDIIKVHQCGIVNNDLQSNQKGYKMENIKEIIAKNLVELRKSHKLTQSALAEKLNYSDKAISRWEHAETLPDIETLCKVCEIYGVSFEYLLQKEQLKVNNPYVKKEKKGRRVILCLIAISAILLAATIAFSTVQALTGNYMWQIYVWSAPIVGIVAAICNQVWWKSKVWAIIHSSFVCWALTAAAYFQFFSRNLWLLFVIATPIQAILILSIFSVNRGGVFRVKKNKPKEKK